MKCRAITIGALRDMYKHNQLELDPPYQRRPVWKKKQRILLIKSIFTGIPIPAIILHKHFDKRKKKDIYDVLDGKQRIETILHFIRLLQINEEDIWTIKLKKNDHEFLEFNFQNLNSHRFNKSNNNIAEKFWSYEIPVIEYEGELTDFFENAVPSKEVFVRINSTGSSLKLNEIRHAEAAGLFFQLGEELEKKYTHRFRDIWQIFSTNEIQRYLFHEYILELCTAIFFQGYSDRRRKLEEYLYNHNWTAKEIKIIKSRFIKVIDWIKNILNDKMFVNTRFVNRSDFYSLFVLLNSLLEQKYVSQNPKDNKVLGNLFIDFSKTAQIASSELKKFDLNKKKLPHDRELLRYIIATRQSTDSISNRQLRHEYLKSLLKGFILKQKDDKRTFDPNIKGVLWTKLLQKTTNPKCPNLDKNPNCKKFLTLDNAQVDHINPWAKGGRSIYQNAQLICSSCNQRKGMK